MLDWSRTQQAVYLTTFRAMKEGAAALKAAKKLATLPEEDEGRKASFEELARRQVHSYALKETSTQVACITCEPGDDLDRVHLQWSLPQSSENYVPCVN